MDLEFLLKNCKTKTQDFPAIMHPIMYKWLQMEEDKVDIEEQAFKALRGKYKHFCWDWDGMAIDETCPEFESCLCYDAAEVKELKNKLSSGGLEGT